MLHGERMSANTVSPTAEKVERIGPARVSRLVNRNVTVVRGRTSMRLEPELWDALEEISRRENRPLGDIVRGVDASSDEGGRTSAVRVYVLKYFRDAAAATHRLSGAAAPREPVGAPADFAGAPIER